ncbi:ABC-type glutathione transport system ATPase component [Bradyrhizobium sp. JR3.5]
MNETVQSSAPVLAVDRLSIALPKGGDRPFAVENVSFEIRPNEVVCLVGESGSGKSMIAHAVLQLCCRGASTSCPAPSWSRGRIRRSSTAAACGTCAAAMPR